jgi:uncharacterized membrane protein YfcA
VHSLIGVGLVGGLFAGLFGLGGGIIMVPLLLWWTAMGQKTAHATSLLAITPAAIVGAVSFGVGGIFEWLPAIFVATGAVVGAQIGAWLLRAMPIGLLRGAFIAFIVASGVMLLIELPDRSQSLEITLVSALLLVALGIATGVAAGLFGVGGGVVVIPVLILFFGYSDLAAKSVSLLAIAPGSLSGSISHLRHKSARLRDGLWIALGAGLTTPLGAIAAFMLTPQLASALFAIFLFFVALNLIIRAFKKSAED